MNMETFAALPHALMTTRRDASGEIDKVLARYSLERRVALTVPHMLVLPVYHLVKQLGLISASTDSIAFR